MLMATMAANLPVDSTKVGPPAWIHGSNGFEFGSPSILCDGRSWRGDGLSVVTSIIYIHIHIYDIK